MTIWNHFSSIKLTLNEKCWLKWKSYIILWNLNISKEMCGNAVFRFLFCIWILSLLTPHYWLSIQKCIGNILTNLNLEGIGKCFFSFLFSVFLPNLHSVTLIFRKLTMIFGLDEIAWQLCCWLKVLNINNLLCKVIHTCIAIY